MGLLRQYGLFAGFGLLYLLLSIYFIWNDVAYFTLIPIGLIGIYFAVYYTEYTFLSLGLLTPFSVNIEEYVDGLGLFIPTEPLLIGMMFLLVFQQLKKNQLPIGFWKNPIVIAVSFYLFWIVITSITSSSPGVSFKFLLAKLWFIVPILFFGISIFGKVERIRTFIWLLCIGTSAVMLYTLAVHSTYGFGEKEGHWVMWPFYKDHTIYGAAIALVIPLIFGLFFLRKHLHFSPLLQFGIIAMIVISLLGLYFSYTRAAWLSIVAALGVYAVIRLKIKFSFIATVIVLVGSVIFFSWDNIQMEMERNKYEHTTEEFGERLQSATNVTTDASNLERINRWSCAIDMFKERPLFGFGPGTYAFEYARFQDPENLTIISTNFGDMGNAHSEYLGPLAEMGFIGLLAMLGIVASIFYVGITLYIKWPAEDKATRILIMSMILSLVTYFVHGALNNYLDTDKASVPIWSFCAAFIGLGLSLKRKEAVNGQSKVLDSDT